MTLNKMIIGKMVAIAIFFITITSATFAQRNNASEMITDKAVLAKLSAAVEATPDSLKVHTAFIKAMGIDNPELINQYEVWMKKYPKNATLPYALGKAYEDQESPKAKPYLLQAVALNPKFTEAWGGLWIDAERWGDFAGGREYLAKAVASDPGNPNYNFYYASSFSGTDEAKYRELSLAVAKKFPAHERGAQALYWLGARSNKVGDKMKYFELLRKSYAPGKFNWSASGMSSYYDILLAENPKKAIALAQEMAKSEKDERKQWNNFAVQAQHVSTAKKLIAEKKTTAAKAMLAQIKLPKYFGFNKQVILLKAQADKLAGNTRAAYDSLIVAFAKAPNVKLKTVIEEYGTHLGKNTVQVETDIWQRLDAIAKVATPFTLKRYDSESSTSLADYKGKVVLLTYWFPGCGPCRGEFPHFENVVKKFKGKDLEYVGINIVSDQNDYVVPFMKTSGYSFTPLEDVKGRVKGNLDNRNAAPVNFLIDQDGRVIFSNFRTDGDNEDELELMINLMLATKKS